MSNFKIVIKTNRNLFKILLLSMIILIPINIENIQFTRNYLLFICMFIILVSSVTNDKLYKHLNVELKYIIGSCLVVVVSISIGHYYLADYYNTNDILGIFYAFCLLLSMILNIFKCRFFKMIYINILIILILIGYILLSYDTTLIQELTFFTICLSILIKSLGGYYD